MKNLLAVVAVLAWTMSAMAETWTDAATGYTWRYKVEAEGVVLDRGTGDAQADRCIEPEPSGTLVLPTMIDGQSVVKIGRSAFEGCSNMVSVVLPSTVTNVGSQAFRGCTRIRSVTFPAGLKASKLFSDSMLSLSEAEVLTSGKALADDTFDGGSNLVSVTLPAELPAIGSRAFRGCIALKELSIPVAVTNVGSSAFNGCAALTEMVVPAGVVKIAGKVFKDCTALKSVTFDGDCPSVGGSIYDGTSELLVTYVHAAAEGWPDDGFWCKRKLSFIFDADDYPTAVVRREDVVGALALTKAQTLRGCVMDRAGTVLGVVELVLGKAGRNGSSVKCTYSQFDGKKYRSTTKGVDLSAGPASLMLKISKKESLSVVVGSDATGAPVFAGSVGSAVATSAPIGGVVDRATLTFTLPKGFAGQLAGGKVNFELLPRAETVEIRGRKWKCAKAASVAYKKDRNTGVYGWVFNGGKVNSDKTNYSGLTLSYQAKTGWFKGSFKAYSIVNGVRLKKTKVSVAGVVLGGTGYGLAVVKNVGAWSIVVE